MDWFAWLSKTSLEPSLVYEYGIIFSRKELQMEDVAFFNHEFLLSMGVFVAKHRLEILKLAKKEKEGGNGGGRSISRLGWALIRTKKCFSNFFTRLSFHETDMSSSPRNVADQPEKYQEHWRGSLLRKPRSIALSGPLDMKTHERLMMVPADPRNLKLSGPLDSKVNERLMYTANRSPRLTPGPMVITDKSMVAAKRSPKASGPFEGKSYDRLMVTKNRSPKLSGPFEGKSFDRLMVTKNRSPKLSGPFEGKSYDRLMVTKNRSPKLSGPLDGRVTPYEKESMDVDFDDHSLWTAMFQDMKPT